MAQKTKANAPDWESNRGHPGVAGGGGPERNKNMNVSFLCRPTFARQITSQSFAKEHRSIDMHTKLTDVGKGMIPDLGGRRIQESV